VEFWHQKRVLNEALCDAMENDFGPIHINIPFNEPLYDTKELTPTTAKFFKNHTPKELEKSILDELAHEWNTASKRLILVGTNFKNHRLNKVLIELTDSGQALVFSETTSNFNYNRAISCIDRMINTISTAELGQLQPDLLVTIGGAVVSKKIKAFLRTHKAKHHWHIAVDEYHPDTNQQLTRKIKALPENVLEYISTKSKHNKTEFTSNWLQKEKAKQEMHRAAIASTTWSDLKAFDLIVDAIPTIIVCKSPTALLCVMHSFLTGIPK